MLTPSLPLPAPLSSAAFRFSFRRKWEAMAGANKAEESGGNNKKANLVAKRKERIKLPEYAGGPSRDFPVGEFFAHPSGVEALLNTRALQSFQSIGSNTYRCTLHKIQLLKFDAVPVLDLRVTPTSEDCTVEMLSCRFEGSESVEQQNNLFSVSFVGKLYRKASTHLSLWIDPFSHYYAVTLRRD